MKGLHHTMKWKCTFEHRGNAQSFSLPSRSDRTSHGRCLGVNAPKLEPGGFYGSRRNQNQTDIQPKAQSSIFLAKYFLSSEKIFCHRTGSWVHWLLRVLSASIYLTQASLLLKTFTTFISKRGEMMVKREGPCLPDQLIRGLRITKSFHGKLLNSSSTLLQWAGMGWTVKDTQSWNLEALLAFTFINDGFSCSGSKRSCENTKEKKQFTDFANNPRC